MLDRASTFADPGLIAILEKRVVPVAVDVWYEARRQDLAGDLYRKVVYQRDGMRPDRTTQGFYIFDPDGRLIDGWNNRDTAKVKAKLQAALATYEPPASRADDLEWKADGRFARSVPEGAVVVEVFSKVLQADYGEPSAGRWGAIHRAARGRDHLWILGPEIAELRQGQFPVSLARRIARFHLIDNTRGEPAMWRSSEVRELRLDAAARKGDLEVQGRARIEATDGTRGFNAALRGRVEFRDDRLERFDLVARGDYRGASRYTQVSVPRGPFRFAVAFRRAEGDVAIPPQGSRNLAGYLKAD